MKLLSVFKSIAAIGLVFACVQNVQAQTSFSYWDWADLWFTQESTDRLPSLDPDKDGASNITEFALGTNPTDSTSKPDTTFFMSFWQLHLHYKVNTANTNIVVMPQATEDLAANGWRGDTFQISSADVPETGLTTVFATDNPGGIPQQRFVRLLIAMDSDGDGISDDWEIAHGLLPFDNSDGFSDADGDGDSAWLEFLQGTDPLDASSNSGLFRIPRAPRDVRVEGTVPLVLMWSDVSDNETEFRIYDGGHALLGTAPINSTSFILPSTFTLGMAVSVSAANNSGESIEIPASTDGNPNGGNGPYEPIESNDAAIPSDHTIYSKLPKPRIEAVRLNATQVQLSWAVPPIADGKLSPVNASIRIKRQKQGEKWTDIYTTSYSENETGEYQDAMPAGKTAKYTAVVVYDAGALGTIGSDTNEPVVDDYVKSLYGTRMNRHYQGIMDMEAPGKNLESGPNRDWHGIGAKSPDGKAPSFIPTNPFGPTSANFTSTPLDGNRNGWRSFPLTGDGHERDTVLAFDGYVIRGKPFTVSNRVLAKNIGVVTSGVTVRLDTHPLRNPPDIFSNENATSDTVIEYVNKGQQIENPTVKIIGDTEKGFDPVTYFGAQTLRGDASVSRVVTFHPSVPTSTSFIYNKTGPFTIQALEPTEVEITPEPLGEGEGTVHLPLDDEEGRLLKVRVLRPKSMTVELRRVFYLDDSDPQNIVTYAGAELPNLGDLQASLNEVFLEQAGVQITVVQGADIVLFWSQLPLLWSSSTHSIPPLPCSKHCGGLTIPTFRRSAQIWRSTSCRVCPLQLLDKLSEFLLELL